MRKRNAITSIKKARFQIQTDSSETSRTYELSTVEGIRGGNDERKAICGGEDGNRWRVESSWENNITRT